MKFVNYLLAGFLVLALMMVRQFQEELFYDPFLKFFQGDYRNAEYPTYNLFKLLLSVFARYAMNAILSLGIIYFLFQNKKYVKYAAFIFLLAFLILTPLYIYIIESKFSLGFTAGFYVRRFLIQPLLLLILIPAFYYLDFQKKENAEGN